MNKISNVFKGVYFTDSFENYSNKELVSLCKFLLFATLIKLAFQVQCRSDDQTSFRKIFQDNTIQEDCQ